MTEEAVKRILEYLAKRGSATWGELRGLGISKATLHRALKYLYESGLVVRVGHGVYALAERERAVQIYDYIKQVCEVTACRDPHELAKNLLTDCGRIVTVIERVQQKFMESYGPLVSGVPIMKGAFMDIYGHKGVFSLILYEFVKFMRGLETMLNCGACEAAKLCPLVSVIHSSTHDVFEEVWGVKRDYIEEIEKLGATLEKHGYAGTIRIKAYETTLEINVGDLLSIALRDATARAGAPIQRLIGEVFKIARSYYETGCRPLGEKEKEALMRLCPPSNKG